MENKVFFKLFFKDGEQINFRCLPASNNTSINGVYNENTASVLKALNEQGKDIYFTVNSGGTHSNEISRINAVFIDWDCGRDKDKNYYDLATVAEFKTQRLEDIHRFELSPSVIVETRNGLHI